MNMLAKYTLNSYTYIPNSLYYGIIDMVAIQLTNLEQFLNSLHRECYFYLGLIIAINRKLGDDHVLSIMGLFSEGHVMFILRICVTAKGKSIYDILEALGQYTLDANDMQKNLKGHVR